MVMDVFGPIEYIVLGFDGSRLTGDMAPALADLLETGTIRIVDLAVVTKDVQWSLSIREPEELDQEVARAFAELQGSVRGLLSEADLDELAGELAPGSTALAMLVEHVWATRFGAAVRAAGRRLILSERIPHAVVEEARASLFSTTPN